MGACSMSLRHYILLRRYAYMTDDVVWCGVLCCGCWMGTERDWNEWKGVKEESTRVLHRAREKREAGNKAQQVLNYWDLTYITVNVKFLGAVLSPFNPFPSLLNDGKQMIQWFNLINWKRHPLSAVRSVSFRSDMDLSMCKFQFNPKYMVLNAHIGASTILFAWRIHILENCFSLSFRARYIEAVHATAGPLYFPSSLLNHNQSIYWSLCWLHAMVIKSPRNIYMVSHV